MKTLPRQHVNGPREMNRIISITLWWAVVQCIFYIYKYYSTLDFIEMEGLSGTFEFWPDFFHTLSLSIFGGVIGGAILVSKPYGREHQISLLCTIISTGTLFSLLYSILAVLGTFTTGFIYFAFQENLQSALQSAMNSLTGHLTSPSFFATMLIWGLLVSTTELVLEISDRLGQGVLWKFITGQYKRPKEEDRIFMFLDLKGATSIAEKMESGRYFEMLKEIYRDITSPIVESSGEIYQYVGDEVVISWPVDRGIRENNALLCFFRIENTLAEKKSGYLKKYGITPSFKAGLHMGKATMGEIGVIKREIVYSGDVLNTTARIQALCNFYEVKILISSTLLQLMKLSAKYISIPIGEIRLKGREQKIALNTIQAL